MYLDYGIAGCKKETSSLSNVGKRNVMSKICKSRTNSIFNKIDLKEKKKKIHRTKSKCI